MIRVEEAIIVEGKYDKIKLSNFIDGMIITTEGFGIFKNKEKQAWLRRLAEKRGLLVLTDSDGAGFVIRNFLKGCVPKEQLYHAFIPDIFGKEKRKDKPSKEGKLGVEGVSEEIIAAAIAASGAHCSLSESSVRTGQPIGKGDFFDWGLTGGSDAVQRRDRLKEHLHLPSKMTTNLLLDTVNCLMTREEFFRTCRQLFGEGMADDCE